MNRLLAMVLVALSGSAFAANDLEPLGSFHNVTSNDGGEHCGGYSVSLWRYRDGRVIGLLDVHSGLCGDPPCGAIGDARLDATGHLRFEASVSGRKVAFDGKLSRRALAGRFNDRHAKLKAEQPYPAPWDTSANAWCHFWSGVHRCAGVRELCASLKP